MEADGKNRAGELKVILGQAWAALICGYSGCV